MRIGVLALIALLGMGTWAASQNKVWVAKRNANVMQSYHLDGTKSNEITFPASDSLVSPMVAENGDVFVLVENQNQVAHVSAGQIVATFAVGNVPHYSTFDPQGNLWIANLNDNGLTQMSTAGSVLGTFAISGPASLRGVAANSFNEIWVAGNDGSVLQMTTGGTAIRTLASTLFTGTSPQMAADQNGDMWVPYSGSGHVVKWDRSNGNSAAVISGLNNPQGVAVNSANELYVATYNATASMLYHYDSTGSLLSSVALGYGANGMALDGNGDVWVYGGPTGTIRKYDRYSLSEMVRIQSRDGDGLASNWSDFTGYQHANIFAPNADADGDNANNRAELIAGANPFSHKSTPTAPQPIVNGVPRIGNTITLTCRFPGDALLGYAIGGSMNLTTGTMQVPGTNKWVPLEGDDFFNFVATNFWHFQNFGGLLDANGQTIASINIPRVAELVGTRWYFSFVTLDNTQTGALKTISNNVAIDLMQNSIN